MKRIIEFFVDRSFMVNLIAGFICLMGVISLSLTKRDLVPPLEFNHVSVTVSLPGASAEEMESLVTFPIEEALKGFPDMEKLESTSKNGSTRFSLSFPASVTNMQEVAENVRARIDGLRYKLPDSIRRIDVRRSRIDEVFLFFAALKGFDENNQEHRLMIKRFERELTSVKGIIRADTYIPDRDLYITFDTKKLNQYGLSLAGLRSALADSFQFKPVGAVRKNETVYSVEIQRLNNSIAELEK